jgi:uncharacterized membrane protein
MYSPLIQIKNNTLLYPKLFTGMATFGYAVLSSFYILVLRVDLSSWLRSGVTTFTNTSGTVLVAIWYTATIISVGLFILNLILFFIFLTYKTEKALKKLKSKTAKDAAIKIRDLKKLLDEGIISKEVFDEKSKKYIEEL